jgi:hypothetical protein
MTWSRRASSAAMVRAASGGVWNRRLDTVRFYERRGVGQHVDAGLRATGCSPSGSHRPSNQSSGERSARRAAGVGAPIPHRRWTAATACRKRSARDTGTPTRAWSLKPPRPATVADGMAVTRGSDPGHRRRQPVRAERHDLLSVDPQSREPPEGAPRVAKRRTWSTSANGASCLLRMTNVTDSMCRVQRIR